MSKKAVSVQMDTFCPKNTLCPSLKNDVKNQWYCKFIANKKKTLIKMIDLTDVGNTRFELVTSCLSSKRSKPTELIAHKAKKKPLARLGGR